MSKVVIVGAARTPVGKFGGTLSTVSAPKLGGIAIKEAVKRAHIQGNDVEEVIMGHVLQGGNGQITSRQASRYADLPWETETETINKVCASGLRSVTLAEQLIRLGEKSVIVAGGMESMSTAPYMLPNARTGYRMGNQQVVDLMVHDGLTCTFKGIHMGVYGSSSAKEEGVSREQQDEWALRSQVRAVNAIKEGLFKEEIVPVEIPQRKGPSIVLENDEGPRADTTLEKLSQLKPAFEKDGTITAGNAPSVNDGAAALVLMSEEKANQLGATPIATILGHTQLAIPAEDFPKTPGLVINKLLKQTNKTVEEIDLFEINEAFAAVALLAIKEANISEEKVNVNGGAVALGHPIGASGARIIVTLIHALKQRGGGIGIAAICSGGGQGDAIMIQV